MTIDFPAERWERLRRDTDAWWAGELDRPLVSLTVDRSDRRGPPPACYHRGFTAGYDFDAVAPEQVVDCWDWELGGKEYLADAFPAVWPNFGPGVAAAFAGCAAEYSAETETVWFHPEGEPSPLAEIGIAARRDRPWFHRVDAIVAAATARWGATGPLCGFTDLGGNLDILSSYRPGEFLLYDLYDCPDQVERVLWEAHAAWWAYYDHFHGRYASRGPGTAAWAGIYSSRRTYMLQCDFCYMISPAMFDRFVKPELAATCAKLDHAFYHLDGVGQLPHLDSLLEIEKLRGVQWVPGAGQPGQAEWAEVYRRIRDAGKLAQPIGASLPELRALADRLGDAGGMQLNVGVRPGPALDEALRICEELDVPV